MVHIKNKKILKKKFKNLWTSWKIKQLCKGQWRQFEQLVEN